MGLNQCPICELNYISEDDKYCNVCRRNMKMGTHETEEQSVCIECGDSAPLAGKELCAECFNEKRRRDKLEKLMENPALSEIDADHLDEIDEDMPSGISRDDLNDIDKEYDEDELDSDKDDFEKEELD